MNIQSIFTGFKTKFLSFFLLLVIVWLVTNIYNTWQRRNLLEEELASLTRRQSQLSERNREIETQLKQLKDPTFLEKEARARFNYQKEGEQLVIFVQPPTSSAISTEAGEKSGIFTKLKNWFKVIFNR